jgi:uncharacterized protein YbjT (DUF2867 family)
MAHRFIAKQREVLTTEPDGGTVPMVRYPPCGESRIVSDDSLSVFSDEEDHQTHEGREIVTGCKHLDTRSETMVKTILTNGGTGLPGRSVAWRLQADRFQVRLLVRDPVKARKMFGAALEVVPGDVTVVDGLEKALMGCQGVHISVGDPIDQLSAENVAALALKPGVERTTYLSGSTVVEQNGWFPIIQQKPMAEKAIRECGVAYTIFCPTWPFESLTLFVRDGRASIIGKHPTPYHWFAAGDLARMVSTAYQLEEAANRRFYIHGSEAITMKQALERYCRVVHPQIGSVSALPAWMAKLLGLLTRHDQLKFAVSLMAYFDKVSELGDPTEANQLLGEPTITLDAWTKHQSESRAGRG